jgi:hypothetical protein
MSDAPPESIWVDEDDARRLVNDSDEYYPCLVSNQAALNSVGYILKSTADKHMDELNQHLDKIIAIECKKREEILQPIRDELGRRMVLDCLVDDNMERAVIKSLALEDKEKE